MTAGDSMGMLKLCSALGEQPRSPNAPENTDLSSKKRTGYWLIIDQVSLVQEVFKF
jgi:hypothetical protein